MTVTHSQTTMFDVPASPETAFNVYHDESGSYIPGAGDRWLLHGVLFVPEAAQGKVYIALQNARQEADFHDEVHYVRLRKSVRGPKARCAMNWLGLYVGQLSECCFYHCLAVDTRSPSFRHDGFAERYHVYNYYARVAIVGGIAWCLASVPRVALRFHSDKRIREDRDNFVTYICRQVCATVESKRQNRSVAYPEVRLLHPEVLLIDSDPASAPRHLSQECELTQLVDLLTSSIAQTLAGASGQKAKIALADMMARYVEDTRKPPWLQTEELHRRFSLSCYPDPQGQFYNPTLVASHRYQMRLFPEPKEDPGPSQP